MKWRRILRFGLYAAAAGVFAAPFAYDRLFPPPQRYASDMDHFKYASVGVEAASGVPYEIWRVLPGICMDPGDRAQGYRRFGFVWEKQRATPVGMPLETALVPRVGINCALCHVGRVEGPDGKTKLLVGAPNTEFDLQAYLNFLYACAKNPNFNADALLAANKAAGGNLNAAQRMLYRALIIPQAKKAIARQAWQLSFMQSQTRWGPGRAAGFQPAKVQVLGQPFDGTLDVVDIPPLWNMRARKGGAYHWDGVNTTLHEVVLSSGIGNGATGRSIDLPSLARVEKWVHAAPAARYPWPVDKVLAKAGQPVFAAQCGECHAPDGARMGQVIPMRMIATDRARMDSFTPETAARFNAFEGYKWRYSHFRKTGGYVAATLDGIWARAPYLHNGSVRTMADLLTPPAARPQGFRRGAIRYDIAAMGFADAGPAQFDTRSPGNSAQGHDWGTKLTDSEKRALIEYLKTL